MCCGHLLARSAWDGAHVQQDGADGAFSLLFDAFVSVHSAVTVNGFGRWPKPHSTPRGIYLGRPDTLGPPQTVSTSKVQSSGEVARKQISHGQRFPIPSLVHCRAGSLSRRRGEARPRRAAPFAPRLSTVVRLRSSLVAQRQEATRRTSNSYRPVPTDVHTASLRLVPVSPPPRGRYGISRPLHVSGRLDLTAISYSPPPSNNSSGGVKGNHGVV